MAEFPALPLWTDAYLGDTTHLTTIEHGAYLLLLMTAWRSPHARLPDDDRLLGRYARCTAGQWKRLRPIIEQFFAVKDGFWTQGRLTDEAVAVRQQRERQSEKGKASALKRKGRHSTTVETGSPPVTTEAQPDANLPYSYSPIPEDKSSGGELQIMDAEAVMWRHGRLYLQSEGIASTRIGKLLGEWKRDYGVGLVIEALGKAQREGAIDCVAFITRCLSGTKGRRGDYDPNVITV